MSLGESDEEEDLALMMTANSGHSPARKRRKLNNGQSQIKSEKIEKESQFESQPRNQKKRSLRQLEQDIGGLHLSEDEEDDNDDDDDNEDNDRNMGNEMKGDNDSETENENDDNDSDNNNNNNNSKKKKQKRNTKKKKNNNKKGKKGKANKKKSQQQQHGSNEIDSEDDDVDNPRYPESTQVGTLYKIELQNFLCHENLKQYFHPNITIICGANGSGKSAVEAGISMALGAKARQTHRGDNVKDVIRYGQDWAIIKLWINNLGAERIKEYGKYIIIERRLSAPLRGKGGGSSSFKIYDSIGNKIGNKIKFVNDITDKFNMHVDNPCVVLKQQDAKEFLNTTNTKKKFELFMKASKLASLQDKIKESRMNVDDAKRDHSNAKKSFGFIKREYEKAKSDYDEMQKMIQHEALLPSLERKLAWLKYLSEHEKEQKKEQEIEIATGKVNEIIAKNEKIGPALEKKEAECEKAKARIASFDEELKEKQAPIQELIAKQKQVIKERKSIAAQRDAKQSEIDEQNRMKKQVLIQIKKLQNEMKKNDKENRLSQLKISIAKYNKLLEDSKNNLSTLNDNYQENGELKSEIARKRERLNNIKHQVHGYNDSIGDYQGKLNRIAKKTMRREELFKPNNARYTVQQLWGHIMAAQRKFVRLPVGPIGYYIDINDDRFTKCVQAAMGSILFSWVCDNENDKEQLTKIFHQCGVGNVHIITRKFRNEAHNIGRSPFENTIVRDLNGENDENSNDNNSNNSRNKPNNNNNNNVRKKLHELEGVYRMIDLFSIKDDGRGNNVWLWNTIIDITSAEKLYAHGDVGMARDFLKKLSKERSRYVRIVYTLFDESNSTKTVRKTATGGIVADVVNESMMILSKDLQSNVAFYQKEMENCRNQINQLNNEYKRLNEEITTFNHNESQYERNVKKLRRTIDECTNKIEEYQNEATNLEENMDDGDEKRLELEQYLDEIKEFDQAIANIETEIQPIEERMEEYKLKLAQLKKEKQELSDSVHMQKINHDSMIGQYGKLQADIEKYKETIKKHQHYLKKLEHVKTKLEKELEPIAAKCEQLKQDAIDKSNGQSDIPVFRKNDSEARISKEIKSLRDGFEDWSNRNDRGQIEARYNEMKPKYEEHEKLVNRACTHIKKMEIALGDRHRQFEDMQRSVRTRLKFRFAQTMRMQGHQGDLEIDYEKQSLEMKVKLKGHDSFTNPDKNEGKKRNTRFSHAKQNKKKKNRGNGNGNDNDNDDDDEAVIDEERDNENELNEFEDLEKNGVRNTKTLSGGERSFTQIAFIMALQEFSGSPFCIYDEFDVFMDSVNRGNSIRILIDTATKQNTNRQYVFITPHDVSPMMKHGDENIMKIHKMHDPRKNT